MLASWHSVDSIIAARVLIRILRLCLSTVGIHIHKNWSEIEDCNMLGSQPCGLMFAILEVLAITKQKNM